MRRVLPGAAVFMLLGATPATGQPPEVADLIRRMQVAYMSIEDYTAKFVRRERIGGKLRDPETIVLKYRKPGQIYMRWTQGKAAGREIIVVKGRDDDRALIHELGWKAWFTIVIAPDSPLVLEESRHPITDVGLGRLIDLLATGTQRSIAHGGLAWKELPPADFPSPGRANRRVELISPRPVANCSCQRAVVTIDVATELPTAAETFDGNYRLLGTYEYHDVSLNPGLTDRDFDPKNPDYKFSGWRIQY